MRRNLIRGMLDEILAVLVSVGSGSLPFLGSLYAGPGYYRSLAKLLAGSPGCGHFASDTDAGHGALGEIALRQSNLQIPGDAEVIVVFEPGGLLPTCFCPSCKRGAGSLWMACCRAN